MTMPLEPADRAWLGRHGIWQATTTPVPLFGMAYPTADLSFPRLTSELGAEALVSLTGAPPPQDRLPSRSLVFDLEDLYGRPQPTDPGRELEELTAAVSAVSGLLAEGVGTIVHCHGGIGRTGTVIGAVAVRSGLEPVTVADWLGRIHSRTGGWPECPWQGAVLARFQPGRDR